MTSKESGELMTPRAVMQYLSISRSTLWRMTQAGKLHAVKLGSQLNRYRRAEVEQMAEKGIGE